jgi:hypothetical protein
VSHIASRQSLACARSLNQHTHTSLVLKPPCGRAAVLEVGQQWAMLAAGRSCLGSSSAAAEPGCGQSASAFWSCADSLSQICLVAGRGQQFDDMVAAQAIMAGMLSLTALVMLCCAPPMCGWAYHRARSPPSSFRPYRLVTVLTGRAVLCCAVLTGCAVLCCVVPATGQGLHQVP